jgi:Rrf2 family iron-sulfur cluster assembly transcriptional regulator
LVHAGILRRVRGPAGGYELGRAAAEISLGDIARAVRTPEDQREKRRGSILRQRILQTVWRDLEEQTSRLMDGVTIEELRERASATTTRRRISHPKPRPLRRVRVVGMDLCGGG